MYKMANQFPTDWGNNQVVSSVRGLRNAIEGAEWNHGHIKIDSFEMSEDEVIDKGVRSESNPNHPIVIRPEKGRRSATITIKGGSLRFNKPKNLIFYGVKFVYAEPER